MSQTVFQRLARPLIAPVRARIAAISTEELTRQYWLLAEGKVMRSVLTLLVYAVAALMVPLPVVLLCAFADFGGEWVGGRALKGLDPARHPDRYVLSLVALVVAQCGFTTALAFAFQSSAPLAQAYAVGALALTMLQLASIRVIHLPYAIVGLAATFCVSFVAVLWNWDQRSGPAGLFLSLLCLVAAAYFIQAVVRTNHALHAGIARERIAAQTADRAKSRFLAQMSHELRTPLNAILGLGHAEMVQARAPASRERLRLVTEAARGLAVILDDILDMSAIEAGHLPIRPAPCNLSTEITAAAALYRPLFDAQGLSCTVNLSSDLPARAVLDAQRLRQCLSNLFSNALKHTTTGGVRLDAGLDESGQLAIHFIDTGPGIPPEQVDLLFQPFQRGTSDQPGTGLGLSITRALARSMGGDLQLLPTQTGAHFRLRLAFEPMTDSPPEVDKTPDPAPAPLPRRIKVLIVDDIATNRLVARTHLRLFDVDTDEAGSGQEALEKILQDPPDLVLLDMNMPGLDGVATLKRIRTLPSRAARLPVIAMTADATDRHRRMYLEAGLDGYLAKPLTPEAVADTLARFAPKL